MELYLPSRIVRTLVGCRPKAINNPGTTLQLQTNTTMNRWNHPNAFWHLKRSSGIRMVLGLWPASVLAISSALA